MSGKEHSISKNISFTSENFNKMEKERDYIPRATWINRFFSIFLSSDDRIGLKLLRYRSNRPNKTLIQIVEELIEFALDEKDRRRD